MPTAKPRITITLTDQHHAVLSALAALQKVSMSSIVVELLDTTLPVLERLAGVLENAANAPQAVLDQIKNTALSAEADLANAHSSVFRQLDLLEKSSSAQVPGDARSEAPGTKPPTSNRGVRITSPNAKIATISPMKKGDKNGCAEK